MKLLAGGSLSGLILFTLANSAFAQTFAPSPNPAASQAAQLQELTKKIDEQNAKIDMLSQQILKLQLQLSEHRPGVIIGETSATVSASNSMAPSASSAGSTPEESKGG